MKTILFLTLSFFIFSCQNAEEIKKEKAKTPLVSDTIPGTIPIAGINCFNDYDAGLTFARQQKKPILLNFTGWASVNDRKMEDRVWVDPEINAMMRDEFVVITLYVDEIQDLPKKQQYKSSFGKDITRLGQKWQDLEMTRYEKNITPLYVILDTNEKILVEPIGYTSDVDLYSAFLKEGLSRFGKI